MPTLPKKLFRCQGCGKDFTPKKNNRTSFCSRGCYFRWKTDCRVERDRIKIAERTTKRVCRVCGTVTKGRASYCPECRKAKARAYAESRYVPAAIANAHKSRQCQRCGKPFSVGTDRRVYCSRRCRMQVGRQTGKHRRRERCRRSHGDLIHPAKAFERDGWVCRICGLPVDPNASVPHPLAPTLDHIIPLAKGGTHTWSNVQCAHFRCNCLKGDRTTG